MADQTQATPGEDIAEVVLERDEALARAESLARELEQSKQIGVEVAIKSGNNEHRAKTAEARFERAEAALAELRASLMLEAMTEYGLQHGTENGMERMGRRSAVRGIMVRLKLYDTFCMLVEKDATDEEVRAALSSKGGE